MDRSKQKRTMASMRDWAIALERVSGRHRITSDSEIDDVAAMFGLSRRDGWGTPYKIRLTDRTYTITSAGADRVFQRIIHSGATENLDDDIVYSNGDFTQYPEGI